MSYNPLASNLRLHYYYYPVFQRRMDTVLSIRMHYLAIPIMLNRAVCSGKKWQCGVGVGAEGRMLLSADDNFEDIILEEIGWIQNTRYRRLSMLLQVETFARRFVGRKTALELRIGYKHGITPFVSPSGRWDIYENLYPCQNKTTYPDSQLFNSNLK